MKKIETAMLQTLRGGNNPSGACIQSMLVYGTVMIGGATLTAATGGLGVFAYFAGLALAAYDAGTKCS
jgi:hypothetical protein